MSGLRLLLLYDLLAPESVGGVEQRNAALATALAARGHSVTLAGPTDLPAGPTEDGYAIEPLAPRWRLPATSGRRTGGDALRYSRLMRGVAAEGFDAIETANIPYAHLASIARRCRRARRPLVVTWHEIWGAAWRSYLAGPISPLFPLFALFERWATRFGAAVITPSRLTARRLPRQARRRAHVVPGGIWRARMERVDPDPSAAPLVVVNRLIPDKRTDLLLRALAAVEWGAARGPLLDVVGDGPERPRLEGLARDLDLGGRVRFRGRLAAAHDVWRVVAGARLAVQPSAREGFGLFALEALALGVPVVFVAARRSAVGEIVRHGVEGIETPPDAAALGATLRALLDDEGRRQDLAAATRRRAAEFDWPLMAGRLEAVVADAIGSGKRGD